MARRFTPFQTLPVRPEYLAAVRRAIKRRQPISRRELPRVAGLSRNQAMCAIEHLVATGEVEFDAATASFTLREGNGGSAPR